MRIGPFSPKDQLIITTLGLEFAVAVALGVGCGFWLDRRLGWTPWGILAGTLGGFALAMYIVVKEACRLSRKEKNKE